MSVGNGPRHCRKASQQNRRVLRARDSNADHFVVGGQGNSAEGRSAGHILRFLALGAAVAVSSPAAAQSINQFVGFGDSTIDSGWYRNNLVGGVPFAGGGNNFNDLFPDAVKQGAGRATTSPGLMSSELLAAFFGTTAIPSNDPSGRGTNFATSGARNKETNGPNDDLFTAAVPTATQVKTYLSNNGGVANPN